MGNRNIVDKKNIIMEKKKLIDAKSISRGGLKAKKYFMGSRDFS